MHQIQSKLISLLRDQGSVPLKYREIGRRIGESHPQSIKHHIELLKERELIVEQNKFIRLNKASEVEGNILNVPFYGLASCGPAMALAESQAEGYIKVSRTFFPSGNVADYLLVQATGNSMNNSHVGKAKQSIDDGDIVLVNHNERNPRNGEYVLSVIGESANIKKYDKPLGADYVKLVSESKDDYLPIILDGTESAYIMGTVKEVIKTS